MKIFLSKKNSCDLNYQHDYICEMLSTQYEITDEEAEADIIVFASSCACTESAITADLNYFYNCLLHKKPEAKVYLTGCLTREFKRPQEVQTQLNWLKEHIDYIIPHNEPNLLLQRISQDFLDLDAKDFGYIGYYPNIAELYIGNGCLNNCAFCKVSYQYYPLKSVPLEEIKEAIGEAIEFGYDAIRIISTNLCQYGLDLYREPKLLDLIAYIESLEQIKTIELFGFAFQDAIHYSFAPTIAENSKIAYLSGSLETGSSRLLKMIRKGFTPEQIIEFVKEIKSKHKRDLDINIIAGLPTENLEDVFQTLTVLKELDPYQVHISEYMSSPYLHHLNAFPQLSKADIVYHRKIYNEVLTRRRVITKVSS